MIHPSLSSDGPLSSTQTQTSSPPAYFELKQDLKEEGMFGVETIAHVRENGRITIMFCAFEGPRRITRPFGRGTAN